MDEEPQRSITENFNAWHTPVLISKGLISKNLIKKGDDMRTELDKAKEAYVQAQDLVNSTKERGLCTKKADQLLLQAHHRIKIARES